MGVWTLFGKVIPRTYVLRLYYVARSGPWLAGAMTERERHSLSMAVEELSRLGSFALRALVVCLQVLPLDRSETCPYYSAGDGLLCSFIFS
jgi:hypothetical protein